MEATGSDKTLAYYNTELITTAKVFIVQATDDLNKPLMV